MNDLTPQTLATSRHLMLQVRAFSLSTLFLLSPFIQPVSGKESITQVKRPAFSAFHNPSPTYVMVAAHRGGYQSQGKTVHPENSILAMKNSIQLGVDILEIDVRKTIDNQLVIMHDSTINRTTNGKGKVGSMTFKELRTFHLKGPKGKMTMEIIPTLAEVMTLSKGKVLVNLDKVNINDAKLLKLIMTTLQETDTVDHAIFKGGATPKQLKLIRAKYPNETILYMPIVSGKSETQMSTILNAHQTEAVELIFRQSSTPMLSKPVLETAAQTHTHIWINSLWSSLCAGHHDSVALGGNPDGSWGWLIDKGATIIQTDNAPQLIEYLQSKGLRKVSQ